MLKVGRDCWLNRLPVGSLFMMAIAENTIFMKGEDERGYLRIIDLTDGDISQSNEYEEEYFKNISEDTMVTPIQCDTDLATFLINKIKCL